MQQFIARENIKRFRQQLESTDDKREQQTLKQLLAEEERRLADCPDDE